jgi:citrate lyase beta subunit
MLMIDSIRSLVFAPANDRRKLLKALSSEADAVVADLADAVPESAKAAARQTVVSTLAAPTGVARMVRVNAFGGAEFERDVEAIAGLQLDAVVLPKATLEAVAALGRDGPPIVAIVETALGLARADELAAAERVVALILGGVDLSVELGLEPLENGDELLYARSKLVLDSACAGITPPFDAAYLRFGDLAGLEREARMARALGLRGKICIHLDQVATVNEVFRGGFAVEWARATIAAYESGGREGRGAVAHEGEMVDYAVVQRARRVLREAQAAR